MPQIAVQCKSITKSFGIGKDLQTVALRGVNVEVYEGEFFMLVGPSGCGKTTLISIIAGVLKPDTGTCIVDRFNYQESLPQDIVRFRAKNIGFIFQSFNLIDSLNVGQNVALPLIINGVKQKEALKRAQEILDEVSLGEKLLSPPNQLSGGQQQRVAIARALIHNPSLLVCDEPTSALDHETGTKVLELMKDINKKFKTTFIIVTHDNRIFKYADRIASMDDGRIERVSRNHEI
jgi:putative ABC transport system ATP-binding protein